MFPVYRGLVHLSRFTPTSDPIVKWPEYSPAGPPALPIPAAPPSHHAGPPSAPGSTPWSETEALRLDGSLATERAAADAYARIANAENTRRADHRRPVFGPPLRCGPKRVRRLRPPAGHRAIEADWRPEQHGVRNHGGHWHFHRDAEFGALLARVGASKAGFARLNGLIARQVNNWCRGRAAVPPREAALAVILQQHSAEAISMLIEETDFAWHETLGVMPNAAADAVGLTIRRVARYHPDRGSTKLQMTRIKAAYAGDKQQRSSRCGRRARI